MSRIPRHEEPLKRPSTLVDRWDLPGVRGREELTRLLRAHDPEVAAESLKRITEEHLPLLRQIAREIPGAYGEPVVRRQAIAMLARFAGPDEVNLLADLARFDRDPAVRGEALLGLGRSGVQLAAPLLGKALASTDAVEATAAAKAVKALAEKVGVAALRVSMGPLLTRGKKLLEQALAQPQQRTRRTKRQVVSRSRRDPNTE